MLAAQYLFPLIAFTYKALEGVVKAAVGTSADFSLAAIVRICKLYIIKVTKVTQTMCPSRQVQAPGSLSFFPLHVCTQFCTSFHTFHLLLY